MTLTNIPNHKEKNIIQWIHGEMTSEYLVKEIYEEYKDIYPIIISNFVPEYEIVKCIEDKTHNILIESDKHTITCLTCGYFVMIK